jgi:hypothetical protein
MGAKPSQEPPHPPSEQVAHNPVLAPPTCLRYHDHHRELLDGAPTGDLCALCSVRTASFVCSPCNHHFCAACASPYFKHEPPPLICPAAHELVARAAHRNHGLQCATCGLLPCTSVMGCAACGYNLCLPCAGAAAFAAARIGDASRDPYDAAMARWADVQRIVPDVVGLVLQFACASGSQAMRIGMVCRSWYKGALADNDLWLQLYRIRWPSSDLVARKASRGLSRYRTRGLVELRMAREGVTPSGSFSPIEQCDLGFCPCIAEALSPCGIDRVQHSGNASYEQYSVCDACRQKVYYTKEPLGVRLHNEVGRRTVFQGAQRIGSRYCVLGDVSDAGASAFAHLNAILRRIVASTPSSTIHQASFHGPVTVVNPKRPVASTFDVQFFERNLPLPGGAYCVYVVTPFLEIRPEQYTERTMAPASPDQHAADIMAGRITGWHGARRYCC